MKMNLTLFKSAGFDLEEEMRMMAKLSAETPKFAQEVTKQNLALVSLAACGHLDEMVTLMLGLTDEEIWSWTVEKMFKAATLNGKVQVVRFMVENGINGKHPGLQTLLHELVLEASETVVLNLSILVKQGGFDVNSMRRSDGFTPLHVVCANGSVSLPVLKLLLLYGADVHAVSNDDWTPSMLIEKNLKHESSADQVCLLSEMEQCFEKNDQP